MQICVYVGMRVYICMFICIAYAYCYLLPLYRLKHTVYAKNAYIIFHSSTRKLALCIYLYNATMHALEL